MRVSKRTLREEVRLSDTASDELLIERAGGGDREAVAELYDRYFDVVFDFVARLVREPAAAEDVTQDTLMAAMAALGSLRQDARFRSWLLTIAYRRAIDHLRAAQRVLPPPASPGQDAFDFAALPDPDPGANPEAAAERKETAALVWEAASGLEPTYYAVLDLHVRRGLPSPEIAEVLGVSRNHAAVMLTRSRQAIRRAVLALVLFRLGRRDCPDLDRELAAAGASSLSPGVRRLIDRHIRGCAACERRALALASAEASLAALAPVAAAAAWKAGVLVTLAGGGAGAAGGVAAGAAGAGGAAAGTGASGGSATTIGVAAAAAAVAIAAVTLLVLAPWRSDEAPAAIAEAPTPTPTLSAPASATPSPVPPPSPTPTPTPTPTPSPTAALPPPSSSAPVARFRLLTLGGDAPVVVKGLLADRTMAAPDRADEVAWYSFTAHPGAPGNAVFSAHVVGPAGEAGAFARLKELRPGDRFEIVLESGARFDYRVTTAELFSLADIPMDYVLELPGSGAQGSGYRVTLITCDGPYVDGKYQSRLVVKAVRE